MEPIVLASASPQRRAILEQLGVPFVVRPAAVEEVEEGDPATVALTNARAKAAAAADMACIASASRPGGTQGGAPNAARYFR